MNDEKKTAGDVEAAEETDAPAQEAETAEETAAPEAEAAAEEAAEEVTAEECTPESRVAALEAEVADLKDRLVRSFAEVENTRRRADKERQNASKYGASGLARDLLEAIDNLRRAIDSVPADAVEQDEALKNLLVGVEMTEQALLTGLEKNDIKRIDPKGEKFTYEYHQAMSELPNTGQPAGTVVEVLAPGYLLHDRLLRPAMVIVAKGDPETPLDDAEPIDTTA